MNRKLRIIRPIVLLSLLALVFLASSSEALFRVRTVHYWAATYGDGIPVFEPEYGCHCVISPCPTVYEVVGEQTTYCDGTTSEWGYVDHPCTDTTVTFGPRCPIEPYGA